MRKTASAITTSSSDRPRRAAGRGGAGLFRVGVEVEAEAVGQGVGQDERGAVVVGAAPGPELGVVGGDAVVALVGQVGEAVAARVLDGVGAGRGVGAAEV